ncbi:Qnr family pentapeptide repeat protein [Vibrio fluvialis]|nr:Qnr family pentapeptide repeat protein [Vibrio fluvialis]MBY7881805.1 Qnr family pentapeptide repeat protein [Vibrio fluvialis]
MKLNHHTYQQTDFSNRDLSNLVFNNCCFYQCNFSRADLRDAKFINCSFIEKSDVEGCNFAYADLRDASFQHCRLAMAHFSGADCFGIELRDCDLKGANFSRARFVNQVSNYMYFCSAYITGCNLSYANLERQCLEKCDLFENRWIGANLHGVSFKESDLSRGSFSEDCWEQARFQGCDLTHIELTGLDPRRVDLTGVKICDWQQEQLLEELGVIVVPD